MKKFDLEEFLKMAFAEDVGDGDHTTNACFPPAHTGKARLLVKEPCTIAGVSIAEKIFKFCDPGCTISTFHQDGEILKPGDIVFTVDAPARTLLTAERLMLNCMQRMSGIATHTRYLTDKIKGLDCKLLDTRKTTPGFRFFEKEAVRIGGGENHRFGLYDMILIKDNHIDFCGGIKNALDAVRQYLGEKKLELKIEIEARSLKDVEEILTIGAVDRILLDNFTPEVMKEAVKMVGGRVMTEASGGITEDTIRAYAETGVNYISVGALTHRVKSVDLSFKAQI